MASAVPLLPIKRSPRLAVEARLHSATNFIGIRNVASIAECAERQLIEIDTVRAVRFPRGHMWRPRGSVRALRRYFH
jgi:hypothetical protein